MRVVAAVVLAVLAVIAVGVGTADSPLSTTGRLSGRLVVPPSSGVAGVVYLYPPNTPVNRELLCTSCLNSPPPPQPLHSDIHIAVPADGTFSAIVPAGSYVVLAEGPQSLTGGYACVGGHVTIGPAGAATVVVRCPAHFVETQ